MDKMNKPVEYLQNKVTAHEVAIVLKDYVKKIQWRSDGCDSLLDIGCGPGTITYEQIIPILPVTFNRIVAADISKEMLEYAKTKYFHPKLTFISLNIEDEDIRKYVIDDQQFDHVTVFFVFHFVQNQMLAMKNVYSLLTDNGDCLMITFGYNSVFDAFLKLSKVDKWSKYMIDCKLYISPYHQLSNKKDEFEKVLTAAGFLYHEVTVVEKSFSYCGLQAMKDVIKAVSGMFDNVPKELQNEWLEEVIKLGCLTSDITKPNSNFTIDYSLIIAYARK